MLCSRSSYALLLFFFALMLTSCSSGGGITTPSPDDSAFQASSYSDFPVAVSGWLADGSPSGGTGMLGIFQAHIDIANLSGELVPLRDGALADVIEAIDITGFLTVSPCYDCVKLESVSLNSSGNLVLSIAIKHPFPMGNPSNPITSMNRADLIVYNVEGIIVTDGAGIYNALGERYHEPLLANADGYTAYLDSSLDDILNTTTTIHPYILHFDDFTSGNYNVSSHPETGFPPAPTEPSGNLVMGQGADFDSQEYEFDIAEDVSFDFIYAISATYGIAAASKLERFTPAAMVPQHNKKAASTVEIEIVSMNLMSGNPLSDADINVKVLDMNHGVAEGSGLDEMLAASDVAQISIMVPDVMSTQITDTNPSPVSGAPRDPADPLTYPYTITNSGDADAGDYYGLVKVLDSYPPAQNTLPLLEGMEGIERVGPTDNPLDGLFAITEFATYQVFQVSVGYGCGPITGQIDSPECPITTFVSGLTQNFVVSAASDNGGNIVEYQMDYDYDGTTFDIDASNTDGIFDDTGPYVNPNCGTPPEDPVTITVAFRATDDCTPPNITIFAECEITVDVCESPLYLYEPDPDRSSLIISGPTVDQPVDPAGELDLGVCENAGEADIDGVYVYDEWNQISRFDHDYVNSIFQAPGLVPSNDTGTHPLPDDGMPGYRLDVAENGYVISSYFDMNETMDLSGIDPLLYDPFPEGNLWVHWEPTLPRPTQIPPDPGDPWPHDPFLALVCVDTTEPLENQIAWEGWDESNHVTVSSPAPGDPQGSAPYDQAEDVLSVMFRNTNPALMEPGTPDFGYRIIYYGHYPPYYVAPTFYTLYDYAWNLGGVNGEEIVGVDRSDKDWLFMCVSGPMFAASISSGSTENLILLDCNQPGSQAWVLDVDTALETLLGYTLDGAILDVECVPYDDNNPIIFDDGTGEEAPQFAALGAILHENGHIYLLAFDDTPGNEAFILFQDIDGTTAITGDPKHIDVGETTMDIHVTSSDGTNAYATVFTLTEQ
ncbi:hypothetical protein J7L05_02930 [bacterium]|nr:hypothetical protein [bacterium]